VVTGIDGERAVDRERAAGTPRFGARGALRRARRPRRELIDHGQSFGARARNRRRVRRSPRGALITGSSSRSSRKPAASRHSKNSPRQSAHGIPLRENVVAGTPCRRVMKGGRTRSNRHAQGFERRSDRGRLIRVEGHDVDQRGEFGERARLSPRRPAVSHVAAAGSFAEWRGRTFDIDGQRRFSIMSASCPPPTMRLDAKLAGGRSTRTNATGPSRETAQIVASAQTVNCCYEELICQ